MKLPILGFVLPLVALTAPAGTPALIPLPQQMQVRLGVFPLCPTPPVPGVAAQATTRILVDGASVDTGQYLAALLFKSTGCQFQVRTNGGATAVRGAILLTTANAMPSLRLPDPAETDRCYGRYRPRADCLRCERCEPN